MTRNKYRAPGSGGSGHTSTDSIPKIYAETRALCKEKDQIAQGMNGPGKRRAGRAWSRRARPWPVNLLEASQRGQWAPARSVVVAVGGVAIRRWRRAVFLGSEFYFCCCCCSHGIYLISQPLVMRWAARWCALGDCVACPRRPPAHVASCSWFQWPATTCPVCVK